MFCCPSDRLNLRSLESTFFTFSEITFLPSVKRTLLPSVKQRFMFLESQRFVSRKRRPPFEKLPFLLSGRVKPLFSITVTQPKKGDDST